MEVDSERGCGGRQTERGSGGRQKERGSRKDKRVCVCLHLDT